MFLLCSDVLRYPKPVMRGSDLNQEELTQFQDDIQRWHDEATMRDKHLREMSDSAVTEANLPPVRTSEPEKKLQDKDPQPAKKSKSQRIKSNDWEAWEKFDADKEIEKIDEDKEEKKPTKNLNCPTTDLPVSDGR
jgi:2-oxoglutarate dehydrogenase complex dehydrogenase (E1) component-like enzyme